MIIFFFLQKIKMPHATAQFYHHYEIRRLHRQKALTYQYVDNNYGKMRYGNVFRKIQKYDMEERLT